MNIAKRGRMAFLTTLFLALPYSAGAAGNPCGYCEAVFQACRAAGGGLSECRRVYIECVHDFGCVIP